MLAWAQVVRDARDSSWCTVKQPSKKRYCRTCDRLIPPASPSRGTIAMLYATSAPIDFATWVAGQVEVCCLLTANPC